MNPAIILDRDGTINEDVGFLYQQEKLAFIPGAIDALKILQEHYLLFIITNQAGIGEGVFSLEEYENFNQYFANFLQGQGISIKEILFCPHQREERCCCRKPRTFFIDQLSKKYDLDIKNSFCIGAFINDQQVGFSRLITDYATFGWLADVYVLPEYRGAGISKKMLAQLFEEPWIKGLRRIMLNTRDAHGLYRQLEFTDLANPTFLLEIARPGIYLTHPYLFAPTES